MSIHLTHSLFTAQTTRKNSFRDLFKGKDKEKIREKARAAEAEKDANATETQGSDQAKDSHHAAETKENEEKKPKEDNTSVVAPSITIDVSEDEEEEEKMIGMSHTRVATPFSFAHHTAQSSESSDAMSGGTQGVDDSVLFNVRQATRNTVSHGPHITAWQDCRSSP